MVWSKVKAEPFSSPSGDESVKRATSPESGITAADRDITAMSQRPQRAKTKSMNKANQQSIASLILRMTRIGLLPLFLSMKSITSKSSI